ncbi:hypothetical protein [Streptomyces sp. NPDC059215]|uniref:hypothetical protein n=1 Tax=Streptomyces sp. NPDC059215 TaxID=3346772 RepID=UPI00367674C0
MPTSRRARVSDRNDDGDTLELALLSLVLGCVASDDPGTWQVGIWGLSVIDFDGTKYFVTVADSATDPDPRVRANVMSTLGSTFGAGPPCGPQPS